LDAIRLLYEPHACALAAYLKLRLPMWAPPAPGARKDGWSTVAGLRQPGAVNDRLTQHVSQQSTAVRLHDEREHPL
jgi:hypothetical protein